MKFGITNVSIMPVRANSDDRSEMITQLLFGEIMEVKQVRRNWSLVRNTYDDYEGWVDTKQYREIPEADAKYLLSSELLFTKEVISHVYDLSSRKELSLVFGSHLVNYLNGKIKILTNEFLVRESPLSLKIITSADAIIEMARKFLDAPYLWGGKTPFGVDCSGFTQSVFKVCGIPLKRDASQQAHQGNTVDFIGDIQPGDLAFFDSVNGDIIHVGIVLDNKRIIHSSGKVRIDILDHNGIFNKEMGDYTHKLRIIKRYL